MIMQSESLKKLKVMKIIRLLRLLKLVRVFKGSQVFKRWETKVPVNYSKLALSKFIVVMLVSGHWMACFWGLCANETQESSTGSWIVEFGFTEVSSSELYLVCLYW